MTRALRIVQNWCNFVSRSRLYNVYADTARQDGGKNKKEKRQYVCTYRLKSRETAQKLEMEPLVFIEG